MENTRNCDDKFVGEIEDTGILFCKIPFTDCIIDCKTCDLYGVNAQIALAIKICKLEERVNYLESIAIERGY